MERIELDLGKRRKNPFNGNPMMLGQQIYRPTMTELSMTHKRETKSKVPSPPDKELSAAWQYLQTRSTQPASIASLRQVLGTVVALVVPEFANEVCIDSFQPGGMTQRHAMFASDELVFAADQKEPRDFRDCERFMKLPLTHAGKFVGSMLFTRLSSSRPFSEDERVNAKRLTRLVASRIAASMSDVTQSDRMLPNVQPELVVESCETRLHQHEGSVTAHSDGKAKGSTFVVRLPTCAAPVLAAATQQPSSPAACKRVLIVDDRRENEYILKALVTKLGAEETRTAGDGPSALAILSGFQPDLILLDLGLQGIGQRRMSGLELAREIRKFDHCRHTFLVAVTGYDDAEMRQQAESAGIDLYRLKPASMGMLEDVFRRVSEKTYCQAQEKAGVQIQRE